MEPARKPAAEDNKDGFASPQSLSTFDPTVPHVMSKRLSRMFKQHRLSDGTHTFWTLRTAAFTQNIISALTAWDLACVVATLMAIAIIFVTLSHLVNENLHDLPSTKTVSVILKDAMKVEGTVVEVDGSEVQVFLGVPFAEPPVSNYRFRKTIPLASPELPDLGVLKTSPACPQPSGIWNVANLSEDCLKLNIWTPSSRCIDDAEDCRNRTVVIFFHGGFFQVGSNSDLHYDGRFLSAFGNLVVVVPNYRLGVLGFLNYDRADAPGNVGLHDQLQAVVWTRDNVGEFGGDPSNIVLMGHGAGAASLGYHLHDATVDLEVDKAVLLSGSPFTRYPENAVTAQDKTHALASIFNCSVEKTQLIACLREVSASNLSDPVVAAQHWTPLFFPSINRSLTRPRKATADERQLSGMDILLGYVEDEGTLLVPLFLQYLRIDDIDPELIPSVAANLLQGLGFSSGPAKLIATLYLQGFGGSRDSWKEALAADVLVVCPLMYYAEYLASAGNRVYTYLMSRQRSYQAGYGVQRGIVTDLLFGRPFLHFHPPEEQVLSRQVIDVFVDFINGGRNMQKPQTIIGLEYYFDVRPLEMAPSDTSGFYFRKTQCDFLRSHYV